MGFTWCLPLDCVKTYNVALPITFYDPQKIIDFDIETYEQNSTTCPDWLNAKDYNKYVVNTTYESNLTITEKFGTITKVSTFYTTTTK